MSKKLKLEHLPMRRNPDRKSQKKKKKKPREYLKQQQVTGIIVLLFVLVTDSWNDVKKKKNQWLNTREISIAIQPTNAGIPAQWIAFHGTIQGYGLFYLAHWHPFSPGLLYTVDRENQGDIVHLLLLSSSWNSHIFLALTVHL